MVTIGPGIESCRLQDGTGNRGIKGEAEVLSCPLTLEEVAEVMAVVRAWHGCR